MDDTLSGCLEGLLGLFLGIVILAGWAFLLALPVMWLWNWIMPILFGLPTLTWVQALGLNLLCSFLFKSKVNVKNKD